MLRLLSLRLASLRRDDRGVALVTVIGLGAVLLLLTATMLTVSLSGMTKSSKDDEWNGAISAAYAGVEDYQSKLAADSSYTKYGDVTTVFSRTSKFIGTGKNPAFGVGPAGTWASVDAAGRSTFRYEVDNSAYADTGVLKLRSTGRVGTTTRTIVANLKQEGFIDFLYFTDYEISDPDFSSSKCVPSYAWDTGHDSDCTEIQFGSSDVIDGPAHSNDTLKICGTTFNGRVTTGYKVAAGKKAYTSDSGCAAPTFKVPLSPEYSPKVSMPQTNLEMLQETRSDLIADGVPNPGCLYTGPTSITFDKDGYMTVRSPWTIATNITGDPVSGGSGNPACGTPGPGGLASAAGERIKVPTNNLIYVQGVTFAPDPVATGDPNDWKSGSVPSTGFVCENSDKGGAGTGNGIGYPVKNEVAPSSSSYGCYAGDVFVKGQMHSTATVAAAHYVYVAGDITYTDPDTDMLGLVGGNAVIVHNPVKKNGDLIDTSKSDRLVSAAILSVEHTFNVQNYSSGAKGKLIITGAIAQKFRGPVALSSGGKITSGYVKSYVYDQRFRFTAPPKFLSPVSTTYGVTRLVESKTAFTSKGVEIK